MPYLLVFSSGFPSATLLPGSSEVALLAAAWDGAHLGWLWLAATAGNTLGAEVNRWLGRLALHWSDRPWFPASVAQLKRASAWFARYGVWSLLFAWLPVVGDALTVVAGTLGVRAAPFLALVALGKGARYAALLAVSGLPG